MPISVTGLVHRFAQDFDADNAISKMMASSRWPRPEYARKVAEDGLLHPLSPEEIKQLWRRNAREAATRGTRMHLQIEVLLNGGSAQGDCWELRLFARFLREYPLPLIAFRTEWCIFAEEEKLAGCIDFVAKCSTREVILFDWKRTKQLRNKYSNPWASMRHPLSHLADSAGVHYRLQLNLYKFILEKYYDLKVRAMHVVCLHPDNCDHGPLLDTVPDMLVEAKATLDTHKLALAADQKDLRGGAAPAEKVFDCKTHDALNVSGATEQGQRGNDNLHESTAEKHGQTQQDGVKSSAATQNSSFGRRPYALVASELRAAGLQPYTASNEMNDREILSGNFNNLYRRRVLLFVGQSVSAGAQEENDSFRSMCANDMRGGASQDSFDARLEQEFDLMDTEDIAADEHADSQTEQLALALPSNLSEDTLAAAKQRRLMPGASTSSDAFDGFFAATSAAYDVSVEARPQASEERISGSVREQCRRILAYTRAHQPAWPEDMTRVGAAAILVYRTRYTDLFVRDFAGLIWIIEGERFIRAHAGVCYLYHDDGAFEVLC